MMNSLVLEKKLLFVNRITRLRQHLNDLEACFSASKPFSDSAAKELQDNLRHLLSDRWDRIRNSSMCYTQQPNNEVNQLCLDIAKALSPPADTAKEIESLAPNTGPYFHIMPSLEQSEDVYGENIHNLSLSEFKLNAYSLRMMAFIEMHLLLQQ